MAKRRRRRKKKVVQEEYYALSSETKRGLLIIFIAAFAVISILSFLDLAGAMGVLIDQGISAVFGVSKVLFPIALLLIMYAIIKPGRLSPRIVTTIGLTLFFLCVNALFHLTIPKEDALDMALAGNGGGLVGYAVSYPLLA